MGSYSWAKLATLAGPSIKTNAGHGHNDFTVQQKWQQQQRRENVLFGQHFCEAGLAGWLAGCVTFWPAVCTSIAHRNAIRINYNHGFNEFLTPCTWPKERDGLTVAHDSLEHPLLAKLPASSHWLLTQIGKMTAVAVSLAGVSAASAALPYLISRKIMRLELQLANALPSPQRQQRVRR